MHKSSSEEMLLPGQFSRGPGYHLGHFKDSKNIARLLSRKILGKRSEYGIKQRGS